MTDAPPKPAFYDIAQPKVTALAVELNEVDGLPLDAVANVLMSGGVALAVGLSGREGTVLALAAISRAIMVGKYDGAIEVDMGAPN